MYRVSPIRYLSVFLYFLLILPVHAEVLKVSDIEGRDLMDSARVIVEGAELKAPERAIEFERWKQEFRQVDNISLFGGEYWLIFDIYNDTPVQDWVIDVNNSLVENIEYHVYAASERQSELSGFYQPDEYMFHYGKSIHIEPGDTIVLAVKVGGRYFASEPSIELTSKERYIESTMLESVLILAALGTLFSFSVYNLFVFLGSREPASLYYSLYLLTYFVSWALVFQVPNELFDFYYLEINYIPFFLLPLVSAYFCINFLQLGTHLPSARKILLWNGYISLALAIVSIFMIQYAHALATVTISVWVLVATYAGVYRWKQGFVAARYFVTAFICLLIPACFILPANIGLIPDLLPNAELATLMGGTLDAIFLAFALADRVELINKQNKDLTSQLESKVEIRTQALQSANHTLEHLIEELQEANETKNRFLANMSHEIRTPLTSIIGYAQGVLLGDIDKQEQHRVLKIISDSGSHLLNVINDILDLNKIEANKLVFENIPAPLFSILSQIESVSSKRAVDKGLKFEHIYHYPLPSEIVTDPTRLKQILLNLTNNALKFTKKGFVSIDVKAETDKLLIKVCDSGIGLDKEQKKELFSPFKQADSSITRRFGGTGLGLSISQHLAKGLGGEITLESEKGKGSEFCLSIELNTTSDTVWVNSAEEVWQAIPDKNTQLDVLPNFAAAKVLLADDHPNNRELVIALLQRMEIKVTAVDNGLKAVEAICKDKYDLILMDIHMPEMDGIQAFKKIRGQGCQTPIIALTANNMKHEVEEYLQIGFNGHLSKPIARQNFIEKLALFLRVEEHHTSIVSSNDMQSLIRDYAKDLVGYLQEVEDAWSRKEFKELQDISHRIKGSAGSFGFSLLGEQFSKIESQLKQQQQDNLASDVARAIAYGRQCTGAPGVDLAQAIVNHQFNVDNVLLGIKKLLEGYQVPMQRLRHAIQHKEPNSALIHLYKLSPEFKQLALGELDKHCEVLSGLLRQGSVYPDECLPIVQSLEQQLERLTEFYLLPSPT